LAVPINRKELSVQEDTVLDGTVLLSSICKEIALRKRKKLRGRHVRNGCLSHCLGRIKAKQRNHARYPSTLKILMDLLQLRPH